MRKCTGKLWTLFTTMLSISAFTFGGGFVIVSLMKRRLVDELHWITEEEMLDMTALAQSCPGAIAVNASILVGRRVAGWRGIIVAVTGTILPPMLILILISYVYQSFASNSWVRAAMRGMQAGVAAVVVDVVLTLLARTLRGRDWLHSLLMAAAFVACSVFRVNVMLVVLAAAGVGVVRALLRRNRRPA